MISLSEYYNTVEMVTEDGKIFSGKVTFDSSTKSGRIEFVDSPYGELVGNFSTTTGGFDAQSSLIGASIDSKGNSSIVPVLSSRSLKNKMNYGRAFLKSNNIVKLRCLFGFKFPKGPSEGWVVRNW